MGEVIVRQALPADVRRIHDIIEPYVIRRILLGKELVTLYEAIQEFVVAEVDGRVMGCGALHVMWEDLGEIRTIAVESSAMGEGIGKHIYIELEKRAAMLGLQRLFCLTFETDFFAGQGFEAVADEVVDPDVYRELLHSNDGGIAEFLDLAHVKPNTLGNTRMLKQLG
ncbi:amino-acid N-acetyltransferase [uncultured Agrococcus sp.]|uniref:amino-acid N-acetyltransferase n=1 Tax=uncultured Agrococcus sp. TaxID=382258 RepID=UPI0025D71A14|nr:amino-acid N-acetyltransferase [uncultured Agrococcus sp.]